MYCKNCGKQIPDDSKYCPHCGTNVSDLPFSDTDKRQDTELHVEYMRMTPSGEDVMDVKKKSGIAPKWVINFAKAASYVNIICILFIIATIVVSIMVNFDEKGLLAKRIIYLIVGPFIIVSAGLNFAFHFIDKPYSMKNAPTAKWAKKSLSSRISQLVVGILLAGFLFAIAYLSKYYPTILANNATVFKVVPVVLCFVYIVVAGLALQFLNVYVVKVKTNVKRY